MPRMRSPRTGAGSTARRTSTGSRTAGMRFDACFCTNSICTPSRAAILTGTYNHVNGVTTLDTHMDNRSTTFPKLLQAAGYQTAMVGKWHLGHGPTHDPTGFDFWRVLPGQGHYHNPVMLGPGARRLVRGDRARRLRDRPDHRRLHRLDRSARPDRPFLLLCHHKAPHRTGSRAASTSRCTTTSTSPSPRPCTTTTPRAPRSCRRCGCDDGPRPGRSQGRRAARADEDDEIRWSYQRYIKDYLRVVASVDDNVGRLLDYLDAEGLADEHGRGVHERPGLLPRRPRLVRQAAHVRGVAAMPFWCATRRW